MDGGEPLLDDDDLEAALTSHDFLFDDQRATRIRRYASNTTSQLAIVGSNLCPIESLDYEMVENQFLKKQDWRNMEPTHIVQYIFLKWILCFLVGAFSGGLGFFNNLAVENIAGVKFVVTSNMMIADRYVAAFAVFAVSNLVLVMFAVVITTFISPAAAGSGIPEVKAYLNGVDAPNIFSLKTLIVKVIGSIAAVSSSLLVGKAGPMMHASACIASILGQGGSRKYNLTCAWLRYFKNDRDRRDLVTCGAAAGIAAAFRAPVGGVLFALECVSSWWRSALLWRTFFTTAIVAVVLRALIDICRSGKCGLFGKGGLIMFDVTSDASYSLEDLPPVIVLGIIGGILGSLYNLLLVKVLRVYNLIHGKGHVYKLLLAASVSTFTSCCIFGLPWLASCKPCPEGSSEDCPSIGRSGNFKKFQCASDHYNDLASLFFNTSDDAIRNLFSASTNKVFQKSSVFLFFLATYFLGIISYGVAVPSGLFVPVILTGATYGRLVGMLMSSHSTLNNGLFAVLGATSLLGGTMRMTVSVCVIILELTNNLLLLPLVMLVSLISKTVADAFNANIYDLIVKLKGLPYLESHAEPYMRQLTVGDVVGGPLRIFNGVEKVSNIVYVLKATGHNGFPVVDEAPFSDSPVLFGLILRAHLLVLLKKKQFLQTCTIAGFDFTKQFSADDFAKRGSGKHSTIEGIQLTAEEMDMYIDLHPFANTSPYTVVETMSLAKALILFREVGLRHLLVIPKSSSVGNSPHLTRTPVVGILTRHDFMPEHMLGLHPFLIQSRWTKWRFGKANLKEVITRICRFQN